MTRLPPRTSTSPVAVRDCRLARTIDLIGDRWAMLILRSALYGVRRFDDFREELGCPRTVLSGRLKMLETEGLMEKRPYQEPGKRVRDEYVLSEKGIALQTALVALNQWGDEWLANGEPPPISFTDAATKTTARVAFVNEDGEEVPVDRLRPRLRKG
ncbi:MAG: helix-turn-helix domain-containing protein [Pseudomonadota bacterium]